MAGPRLTALQRQFDSLTAGINTINRTAADAGREPTAEEAAQLDQLFDRAEQLKPEIEKLAASERTIAEIEQTFARVNGLGSLDRSHQGGRPAPVEMSASEYLSGYIAARLGGDVDEFIDRASAYFDRATMTSSDAAGVLPTPIVGNVIKFADSRRPVFNSFTASTMPAKGKTFERPRITQRVTVAEQAAEGDTLASQKMILTSDTVTKATYGGSLELTHQDIDWTEPSALEAVIRDFAEVYAEFTEAKAVAHLAGIITAGDAAVNGSTYSAYTATNITTIVDSYVDGVLAVYNKAKRMPDTIWLDLASWAALVTTTNTDESVMALDMVRKALSDVNVDRPMRWVVGPQLAANTRIIGCSELVESYEQQKGLLRAEVPTALKVELAYAGYAAFWGRHEGFVKLATDPTP